MKTVLSLVLLCFASVGRAQSVTTLEDYNNSLITVGVAWRSGANGYYPSFYAGFAPRVEDPNRIHLHLGRGNNMRLTAPLDEYTVLTYLYGLKKRSDVYGLLFSRKFITPVSHSQADYFRNIVASPVYGISDATLAFENGRLSREAFYDASLNTLKTLNPGRVFPVRIDFAKAALAWRDSSLRGWVESTRGTGLDKNLRSAIVVANDLVFGRINALRFTDSQKTKFNQLAAAATTSPVADDAFVALAADFFRDVTLGRYNFRTTEGGRFRDAFECPSLARCDLVYTEFTAVYPVGSVLAKVSDRDGNSINMIRENGVTHFVERAYHDVDHIRVEPYYGWITKMDYTYTGNGIHNPAVRTWLSSGKYKWLYQQLGIAKTDDTLWIVSRGAVSHGCTRVSAGHINEVRNIFPSNPRVMTKIEYTGNLSADYDIFDIDADGRPEVMGVDYLVAYALKSENGDGYREANGLIGASFKKDEFYAQLYGTRNQFTNVNGRYVINNPSMSYFLLPAPNAERAAAFTVQKRGEFALYEQAYEKDKLQLYSIPSTGLGALASNGNNKSNRAAQIVRLLGRIAGCGPFASEFKACYQNGFEQEMLNLTGFGR